MRSEAFPQSAATPFVGVLSYAQLKSHPAFLRAKQGDPSAAWSLACDAYPDEHLEAIAARAPEGLLVVPVLAREQDCHNHLPGALARRLVNALPGAKICLEVVEANTPHHTGADVMERLVARPIFDGTPEQPGSMCLLVDDVVTMGGTLAELAHHLQCHGHQIAGVAVLSSSSRAGTLCPDQRQVRRLEERLGDAIRAEFDIEPSALTADECQYLVGFRSPAELSHRANTARCEIGRRLLSKARPELRLELSEQPVGSLDLTGRSPTAGVTGASFDPS